MHILNKKLIRSISINDWSLRGVNRKVFFFILLALSYLSSSIGKKYPIQDKKSALTILQAITSSEYSLAINSYYGS